MNILKTLTSLFCKREYKSVVVNRLPLVINDDEYILIYEDRNEYESVTINEEFENLEGKTFKHTIDGVERIFLYTGRKEFNVVRDEDKAPNLNLYFLVKEVGVNEDKIKAKPDFVFKQNYLN